MKRRSFRLDLIFIDIPKDAGKRETIPTMGVGFLAASRERSMGVDAVLILGPSSAKLELLDYLHAHRQTPPSRVVDVETADHPTDGEIVARGRSHFNVGSSR